MFGLSLGELLLIFLISIVFIGPKEIPIVVRFLSQLFQRLKAFQQEAVTFFNDLNEQSHPPKDDAQPSNDHPHDSSSSGKNISS